MPVTRYTTWGSVRGGCGHLHMTVESAERCAARDQRDCRRQGGYSDRTIRRLNGGSVAEVRRSLEHYDVTRGPGRPVIH